MEGISGGLGNLPWGCRHQGWVLSHLKGPTFWNLPTLTVGIFSRGGEMGGGRALSMPLPNHMEGLLVFSPHFEGLDFFLSGPRAPPPPCLLELMGRKILDLPLLLPMSLHFFPQFLGSTHASYLHCSLIIATCSHPDLMSRIDHVFL